MKILYKSSQVRDAIIKLFKSSKKRRVAITAFVGDCAGAYLPNPEGIELICWPKAGGTNPYEIRELLDRKVKVFFSDRLHMKVYWTEDKGAIISSANLTTNALGVGELREIGVFFRSEQIDINRIIASLNKYPANEKNLDKLESKHRNFLKKKLWPPPKQRSFKFNKWYQMKFRPSWKLGSFESCQLRLSKRAEIKLEKEHGSKKYYDLLNASKGWYKENDWILCFNSEKKNPRFFSWLMAHHIIQVMRSDKKAYDPERPFQVIQVYNRKVYGSPPFEIDKRFRKAFIKAVNDLGGLDKIDKFSKPTVKMINLINKYY